MRAGGKPDAAKREAERAEVGEPWPTYSSRTPGRTASSSNGSPRRCVNSAGRPGSTPPALRTRKCFRRPSGRLSRSRTHSCSSSRRRPSFRRSAIKRSPTPGPWPSGSCRSCGSPFPTPKSPKRSGTGTGSHPPTATTMTLLWPGWCRPSTPISSSAGNTPGILVKALEWDHEGQERSFLFRGTELKAAEGWLARTGAGRRPGIDGSPARLCPGQSPCGDPPRSDHRRGQCGGRRHRPGIGCARPRVAKPGRLVRPGLAALALAAESQNDLSTDPEVSVIVAQEAVRLKPIPQAVSALRQAMDTSALRVALPTVAPEQCGFESGPSARLQPER